MIDRLKQAFPKDRLVSTLISLGVALVGFGIMFTNTSPESITAFSTGFAVFAIGIGGAFWNFRNVEPIDS
ncbi:hypothetical protein HZB69_00395 [Candidatus Amesbacteria bacterium]|nr:hypothetical protein [Candidatus Amesbacteria bacterium]